MDIFRKGTNSAVLFSTILLLSISNYAVIVNSQTNPTLAQMCGLVDVERDEKFPSCCGKSVGPLGNTANLASDYLASQKESIIAEEQLHQYFWDEAYVGHPRTFPLCITEKNRALGRNKQLKQIITNIYQDFRKEGGQRFHKFDKDKDLTTSPGSWIQKIELSRINTVFSDMVNMRQWFHMKIVLNTVNLPKGAGLLMHHVVGPLGLPLGEFNIDFNCADGGDAGNLRAGAGTYYCDFRPMAMAHVHTYTQVSCLETRYIQFIVIPVKTFDDQMTKGKDFQMYLSPVFTMKTAFDSKDGMPYPVYLTNVWSDQYYFCFLKSQAELKAQFPQVLPIPQIESTKEAADRFWADIPWEENPNLLRILPNYEYEHCTLSENLKGRKNESRQCPPGPFNCDENMRAKSDNEVLKSHEQWFIEENKASECFEKCPLAVSGGEGAAFDEKGGINMQNAWESAADASIHGLIANLAYFVLIPIANLMGRFYKEHPKRVVCNMQFWILGHIALHLFAMVVAWGAMAVVSTGSTVDSAHPECEGQTTSSADCAALYAKSASHISLSAIAFIAHHVHFVTGCLRSQKEWIRKIQVTLHSIGGYATYGLILVSISVSTPVCSLDTFLMMGFHVAVLVIVFVCLTVFECQMDNVLGVIPKRKHFPILDNIIVESQHTTPGPFQRLQLVKNVTIIGACCTIGLIWILNLASIISLKLNVEGYVRTNRSGKLKGALFGHCGGTEGIFDYYK